MDKPLVSVITITRNRGQLIGRCIASVLGQTYRNIEYIIVDGASNDNTDEVVSSFQDDRLNYVKLETNWPIVDTINHGVKLSTGKYITFLDSDDEYVPTKIEKQVRLIESLSEDYGMIYCWMTYYDNETKQVDRIHKPALRGDVSIDSISSPIISGTPSLMFRRETLIELDGWKSPEEIGIISDWELCARACQKYKIDYVPESLVNVFINHGSVRQSQPSYYDSFYRRNIKFHQYFLSEFESLFINHPQAAKLHYQLLTHYYSCLNEHSQAFFYLKKYFRLSPFSIVSIRLFLGILIGK